MAQNFCKPVIPPKQGSAIERSQTARQATESQSWFLLLWSHYGIQPQPLTDYLTCLILLLHNNPQ